MENAWNTDITCGRMSKWKNGWNKGINHGGETSLNFCFVSSELEVCKVVPTLLFHSKSHQLNLFLINKQPLNYLYNGKNIYTDYYT